MDADLTSPAAYRLNAAGMLPPGEIDIVREIYESGFPPHHRADFRSLLDGRQPGERALALTGPAGPCGFAMLRPLGTTGWMFLRYLVVAAERRGQGLGGVLWERLTDTLRASGYTLLVFDVEDPGESGCPDYEVRIRSRRIAFYQRHGAVLLPVTGYRAPHGDSGEPGWSPMLLLAARLAGSGPPAATTASLRAVVAAVYRHRWSLPPDHPQVLGTGYAGGRHGPAGGE
jgi:GNAT superfamily N-acetyltransferase